MDAGFIQIHEFDVVLVYALVVVLLQARSLCAHSIWWCEECHNITLDRICDAGTSLLGLEVVQSTIGLGVKEEVRVVADIEVEGSPRPHLFVQNLQLFVWDI